MWGPLSGLQLYEGGSFADLAVQPDGKIVAVGRTSASGGDFLVARFTAAGALDRSFGGNGYETFDFQGNEDSAYAVLIQADGKIVVGGRSRGAGSQSFALLRLDRDGRIDPTYGTGGRVAESDARGNLIIAALAQTADGGVIAVGQTASGAGAVICKFTAAGVRDAAFNGSGSVQGRLSDVAIDHAGRVVTVDSSFGQVFRLTPTGSLDTTFAGHGTRYVWFTDDDETDDRAHATAVECLPDGRIVVGGGWSPGIFDSFPGLARLKTDGAYDESFDGDGRRLIDDRGFVSDIALLPNGSLVVSGSNIPTREEATMFVAVVETGGSLDAAFDDDGILTRPWPSPGAQSASALDVTPDGHFVVAGSIIIPAQAGQPAVDQPLIAQYQGLLPRRDDLLGWTGTGDWYAAASDGTTLANRYFGTWNRNAGWKAVETADVNGDGKADVLGRDSTGQWWIGFNTGAAFHTVKAAKWNEAAGWRDLRFADFNGDGKADVAARTSGGQWWISLSTGAGLANGALWSAWNEAAQWRDVLAADFTGDGRADLAGRTSGGEWFVGRSDGTKFALDRWGRWNEAAGWRDVKAADFDGDGFIDVVGRASNGQWFVARSQVFVFGREFWSFATSLWGGWTEAAGWKDVAVGDFDGDGRADVIGRAGNGEWHVGRANAAGTAFLFARWDVWNEAALWRDVQVGDFDGDGKSDIAGRTSGGEWWVSRSTGTAFAKGRWGKWTEAAGWTTFRNEFAPTV